MLIVITVLTTHSRLYYTDYSTMSPAPWHFTISIYSTASTSSSYINKRNFIAIIFQPKESQQKLTLHCTVNPIDLCTGFFSPHQKCLLFFSILKQELKITPRPYDVYAILLYSQSEENISLTWLYFCDISLENNRYTNVSYMRSVVSRQVLVNLLIYQDTGQ